MTDRTKTPALQLVDVEAVPAHPDRAILHRISDSWARRAFELRIEREEAARARVLDLDDDFEDDDFEDFDE